VAMVQLVSVGLVFRMSYVWALQSAILIKYFTKRPS